VSLALKIIVGVAALALGFWLGLPGRYTQTPEDIEHDMEWRRSGGTYRVKRSFTPFAWLFRKPSARMDRSRSRRPFHLESPDDKDE
jgi:hypothetical protein